jgi:hypothetical protein
MRRFKNRLTINNLGTLALMVFFLLLPSTRVLAQRAPSQAELKERRGTIVDENLQLRGAVKEQKIDHAENPKQLRVVMEQTIQDFDRIQALDREFMIPLMAKKPFDYKNLAEMTTDIRKRAKRLKDNMNLPPPDATKETDQKKWDEIDQTRMKDALLALDDVIGRFVTNPLFQTSNWLDIPLGKKASRDLEIIIELSGQIKKNAERLSKSNP